MNILFFITHKTLGEENCELTFISLNSQYNFVFDVFYIYNSHPEELSNETIIYLYNKYNLGRFFKTLKIFDYDTSTPKTLGYDIKTITEYVLKNYDINDRVLFLKSDILLSKNYFNELSKINVNEVYFTSPLVNAKKRVKNSEILEYINRPFFIRSDDITFYVEDSIQSNDNDFHNRSIEIIDKSIKFISCEVIRDWSCHFISVNLFHKLFITSRTWGGINLQGLSDYHIKTDKCFVIHKYHDIKSQNRTSSREGPVEHWLLS